MIGNLFLCFPVPERSHDAIRAAASSVTLPPGWRTVDASEWHLTLVFIGPHDPAPFTNMLQVLTAELPPLPLTGWSFFPHPGSARVLALSGPTPPALNALVGELTNRASAAGWQPLHAKPFVWHLTVARGPLASAWDVPVFEPIPIQPETVELWQTLGLNPARYASVASVPCAPTSSASPSTI
jgi:2'-5' RNA ligase